MRHRPRRSLSALFPWSDAACLTLRSCMVLTKTFIWPSACLTKHVKRTVTLCAGNACIVEVASSQVGSFMGEVVERVCRQGTVVHNEWIAFVSLIRFWWITQKEDRNWHRSGYLFAYYAGRVVAWQCKPERGYFLWNIFGDWNEVMQFIISLSWHYGLICLGVLLYIFAWSGYSHNN